RYSEGKRTLARVGLFALPGVAVLVALAVWAESKRRLRSRVPRHLKSGRKLFLSTEYDAALAGYNHALQISPYLGGAYSGRACIHPARGAIDRARADLDHALQCDPRLYPAYLERARLRTETGDFDGALGDFSQLLIIRGNDPELYLNRGICLVKQGQV